MRPYNYHLYLSRRERKLSIRRMAKAMKINPFYYNLIEKGYLKPGKKTVAKISQYLGEDFSLYMADARNNPADLPIKEDGRFISWLYRLVGKLWMRIAMGVLALTAIGFAVTGAFMQANLSKTAGDYYSSDYKSLVNEVREKGDVSFNLLDDFTRPVIHKTSPDPDTGLTKYVALSGYYEESVTQYDLKMRATYRFPSYRLDVKIEEGLFGGYPLSLNMTLVNYETTARESFVLYCDENGGVVDFLGTEEKLASLHEIVGDKETKVIPDINELIAEKTTSHLRASDIFARQREASERMIAIEGFSMLAVLGGAVLGGVFLFAFAYCMLYGRKKGARRAFTRDYVEIIDPPTTPNWPLKKDIRITPFIPETIFEFIGIGFVFVGSFRIASMVGGFFGLTSLGTYMQAGGAQEAMSTFMIGMFLLYFMDFDIFLEDQRVARNIFLYGIVWFLLYLLEVSIINALTINSVVGMVTGNLVIPNMFGSMTCYFAIMFFLFYSPKWIKSKTGMIIHRCLAILPISVIIVSWILFKGDGVFFDLDWSLEVRYLFNGERFAFSALAILYLVGYYFLRLFHKRRLGEENAYVYFNSNRFIWQKNILMALIILSVGFFELAFMNNANAHRLDIGYSWRILFLAPLLLFYHPHKGPRNRAVDWTVNIIYYLALFIAYISIAFVAIIGFASNNM